ESADAISLRRAGGNAFLSASQSNPGPGLFADGGRRRDAAVHSDHVWAFALVGRVGQALWFALAFGDWSNDRRGGVRSLYQGRCRQQLLDNVLSGGGRAWTRHGDRSSAADDNRNEL